MPDETDESAAGLVGRQAERAELDRLLGEIRQGRGAVRVLRGEPGIGKTALVEYACRAAQGLRVLCFSASPSESDLPFAGLHALLRPLLRGLGALPSGQADVLRVALALAPGEPADRFATYAATLNLLAASAAEQPLLICVDDAQWLDLPTGEALAFTARRLEVDPVGMLIAERPGHRPVVDERVFPVIELTGLGDEDAAELLRAAGAPAAPPVIAKLARETAGNPLALCEVAARLTAAQRGGAEAIPEPLPAGAAAEALFADRINALDPAARTALLVAAAEPTAGLDALRRAVAALGHPAGGDSPGPGVREPAGPVHDGTAGAAGPDLWEPAERAGLVWCADDRLRFRHPLVRSAIFALVTDAERRAAHRAIAGALTAPADADRRAWHLAYAAAGRDEQAARALEEAAGNARRRTGYAAASVALARAAALSREPGLQARRLRAAADDARMAGQAQTAVGHLRVALDLSDDPRLSAELLHTLGRVHLFDGRVREAATLLARGAELLTGEAGRIGPPGDAALGLAATSLYAESAFAALVAGRVEASYEAASLAHGRKPEPGSPAEMITQLVLGTALFHLSPAAESFRMFMTAAGIAESGIAGLDPEYVVFAAVALLWAGQADRALALLRRVEEEARRSVALGVLPCVLYGISYVYSRTGRFVAAAASAAEAIQVADETGERLWSYFNGGCLAYAAAVRGQEQDCLARIADVEEVARLLDIEYPATTADSLGMLALGLGRYEEAIAHLEPVNRAGIRETGEIMLGRPTALDLVEAYIRAGRELRPAVAAQLTVLSEQADLPAQAALAYRCRGLAAPDDEVDALFRTAYLLHDRAPNPLARARTALCYGERLRRGGRRGDARVQLRAAFAAFSRMDAGVWAARAREELRATGERLEPAGGEGIVARLTPQELQIAIAVANGMSNREVALKRFLSEKTVEFHLSKIYRKAGVRSRTELTRLLMAGGELPPAP
jgi:DNA-binding CsgD family transcriptional regulator/tetratricopeptide (TPR) repeat protein